MARGLQLAAYCLHVHAYWFSLFEIGSVGLGFALFSEHIGFHCNSNVRQCRAHHFPLHRDLLLLCAVVMWCSDLAFA